MKNHLNNILLCLLTILMFKTTIQASEQARVSTEIDGLIEQFNKIGADQESKWLISLKSPLSMVENPHPSFNDLVTGRVKQLSLSGSRVAAESKKSKESRRDQLIEDTLGESQLTIDNQLAELQANEEFAKQLVKENARITRIYRRSLRNLSK